MSNYTIGERRHTSHGQVYQLEKIDDDGIHLYVRHIGETANQSREPWDLHVRYRWCYFHWESIPVVGESTNDFPAFGLFLPRATREV